VKRKLTFIVVQSRRNLVRRRLGFESSQRKSCRIHRSDSDRSDPFRFHRGRRCRDLIRGCCYGRRGIDDGEGRRRNGGGSARVERFEMAEDDSNHRLNGRFCCSTKEFYEMPRRGEVRSV